MPAVAQGAQHLEPGHPGQPEVEDDQVVLAARGEPQPLEPVVHQVGVVAAAPRGRA